MNKKIINIYEYDSNLDNKNHKYLVIETDDKRIEINRYYNENFNLEKLIKLLLIIS